MPGIIDTFYPEEIAFRAPFRVARDSWKDVRLYYFDQEAEASINGNIAGLKNTDLNQCKEYITILGFHGDGRAVPALIDLLQHDADAGVREYAALALGMIGDERAVKPLCERIQVETTEWPRSAAAWALGQIGDSRAADVLAAALPGQNPRFLVRAARSLLQLGDARGSDTLAALIADPDWMVSELACYGFATVHSPQPAAVTILLNQLARVTGENTEENLSTRYKLLRSLAVVADATAAEPLWAFLQTHDDPLTNALAVRALAHAGNPAMVDALYQVALDALDDESRTAAALGLLKLHDPRATDLLLELAKAPFGLGRNSAIYALVAVNDPRVTDTCAALLQDDDPLTRALAARVLARRHDPRGIPVLLALLQEGTESAVRIAAARFLAEAKARQALTPLCTALKTAYPEERIAFAEALSTLGDPAAIPTLKVYSMYYHSRVSQAAKKALMHLEVKKH